MKDCVICYFKTIIDLIRLDVFMSLLSNDKDHLQYI